MCSSDLKEFVEENFLDLSLGKLIDEFDEDYEELFNPRVAFGSHSFLSLLHYDQLYLPLSDNRHT